MGLFGSSGSAIAAAAVLLFLFVCLMAWTFSRYRKAGPNEALIVYGGDSKPRVMVGGGTIVWPFINECKRISLEPMSVHVAVEDVQAEGGTTVAVEGLAQVKVERTNAMILEAAEHILDKPEGEIEEFALESIEGHLRSAMRAMTPETAHQEREQLAQRVVEGATSDLASMGLCVESFILRDVRES